MSRAEALVLKALDEGLDEAERAELDALRTDPETDRRCALLEDLEGALLAGRALPDLGPAVVEWIRRGQAERVMERVRSTSPAWRRRAWPRAVAAAALFLALLVPALLRPPVLARTADGAPLRAGDVVRTGPAGAELRYEGEATRILIVPHSQIVLRGELRAKRIELVQGEIEADVAPQETPLVIASLQARAEVLGTRLRMSATADAARLEVEEGRVRFTREADGAALLVSAKQYTLAVPEEDFVALPVPAPAAAAPRIAGFTLIHLDPPRAPIRELRDGDVIRLSELPTRRVNIRADAEPERVGSLRFAYRGREAFNTEIIWPYTLVPGKGEKGRVWDPEPGAHVITATPFTGGYGNGLRGEPRTITITVTE